MYNKLIAGRDAKSGQTLTFEPSALVQLKMCGALQYKPRVFDRGCVVFVKVCPMYADHAHTHAAVASVSAEQQPEGWRFVPDTILPGYQWAPQWVPVRTPTVHWGPINGKGRGWPAHSLTKQCRVQYSSHTAQKHPKHFFFSFFLSGKLGNKSVTFLPRGFHTTARGRKRAHLTVPALQAPPEFHEKTPSEREKE